jgi:hypothetical protein
LDFISFVDNTATNDAGANAVASRQRCHSTGASASFHIILPRTLVNLPDLSVINMQPEPEMCKQNFAQRLFPQQNRFDFKENIVSYHDTIFFKRTIKYLIIRSCDEKDYRG